MDFEELLRDARLGEGAAFAELWSRHATRVAGFVRARGATDVEEITSDVFAAAFDGIGRFQGEESGFVALLMTIARRRVADEHRRRSRQVPIATWQHDPRRTGPGGQQGNDSYSSAAGSQPHTSSSDKPHPNPSKTQPRTPMPAAS